MRTGENTRAKSLEKRISSDSVWRLDPYPAIPNAHHPKTLVACVPPKGATLCCAGIVRRESCGNSSGCIRDAGVSAMNN